MGVLSQTPPSYSFSAAHSSIYDMQLCLWQFQEILFVYFKQRKLFFFYTLVNLSGFLQGHSITKYSCTKETCVMGIKYTFSYHHLLSLIELYTMKMCLKL